MKSVFKLWITSILLSFLFSCAAPKHFQDKESQKRQKEIKNSRASNVFVDILAGTFSVISAAALDTEVDFEPTEQQFKKMKLVNPTTDTMYVNMLTDVSWGGTDYCDFMDIRIPPRSKCKLLVPINANYNIYFSNTPESLDDEKLEIFTTSVNKISLYPGITATNDKKETGN